MELATGAVLSRHQPEPGGTLTSIGELVRIADGCQECCTIGCADTGNGQQTLVGGMPTGQRFDAYLKRIVRVLAVARGQGPTSGSASLRYSTYDDQNPANDGGLQYQIKNHDTVLVFADSFEEGSPLILWQGTPTEIRTRLESLADFVEKMSDDDLAFEGILQEDRVTQLALYRTLLTTLRSTP